MQVKTQLEEKDALIKKLEHDNLVLKRVREPCFLLPPCSLLPAPCSPILASTYLHIPPLFSNSHSDLFFPSPLNLPALLRGWSGC